MGAFFLSAIVAFICKIYPVRDKQLELVAWTAYWVSHYSIKYEIGCVPLFYLR